MIEPDVHIFLEERSGIARTGEPIRIGVPLPRGSVRDVSELEVCDARELPLAHQLQSLAFWPDKSCKWVLVDALVNCDAGTREHIVLRGRRVQQAKPDAVLIRVDESPNELTVDTGVARFRHDLAKGLTASQASRDDVSFFSDGQILLEGTDGASYPVQVDEHRVEERGPIRVIVAASGAIHLPKASLPLCVKARSIYVAGSGCARVEIQLHNPQASRHAGGLWDLGDANSMFFNDLTFRIRTSSAAQHIAWRAEPSQSLQRTPRGKWSIFQASSGGEHWDSPNHVDQHGRLPLQFRGYRVTMDATRIGTAESGERAQPLAAIVGERAGVAMSVERFWQNFPKALRCEGEILSSGLFPSEHGAAFELQGGEQKRHALFLEVDPKCEFRTIGWAQQPLDVSVSPSAIERSGALSAFISQDKDENREYLDYIRHAVEGQNSFFAKREVIDEYGWRNFGELYADHEAVKHGGPRALVSHYNNQYDFIYGGLVHFLRSTDRRWFELGRDAAQHTIDIDIYHTEQDKAAFNGGMFWHTDHYQDAATSTHRTYSRHNAVGTHYGGGPSNEHNYTSGLLLYYYLSGDPEARAAVLELADWVMRMDDGSLTLLSLLNTRPTGAASKTRSEAFHGPGRGAGNSINALLDAYSLTGAIRYLLKAQELVRRCIHPEDRIETLKLDEPESRWSYLVFLQILGKFLDLKAEIGESDYSYHYARESLLHYGRWMVRHEQPYKDVLHKVEIPTETWPAQDIRKCHVLHLAAKYADRSEEFLFQEKAAFFFQRCLADLLTFETAYVARPMVLLTVYGHVHSYFSAVQPRSMPVVQHNYVFGSPEQFHGQRGNLGGDLRERARLVFSELRRLVRDKSYDIRTRLASRSGPGTRS